MAKTSMKSTALESRVSLQEHGFLPWLGQFSTRYGLPVICILLIALFSLTTPSFASLLTLQAILDSKSKIALLALAADQPPPAGDLASLRLPMRAVLLHHLGGRGLASWDMLGTLARLAPAPGD